MRNLVSGGLSILGIGENRWGQGLEPERLGTPLQNALSLIYGVEEWAHWPQPLAKGFTYSLGSEIISEEYFVDL